MKLWLRVGIVLTFVLTVLPRGVVRAGDMSTIDFDTYTATIGHTVQQIIVSNNTTIVHQYHVQGIDFINRDPLTEGLVNFPVAVADSGAPSAPNVASITTPACHGEFCTSSIVGQFVVPAHHVSVSAGLLDVIPGSPFHSDSVTMTAMDASGNPLPDSSATTTATVEAASGFSTVLTVSSLYNIAYIAIWGRVPSMHVGIDDLRFDQATTTPDPDFGLSGKDPLLFLGAGRSVSTTLTVHCLYGSTGAIDLSVSGLPGHVSESLSPSTAHCPDVTTITLTLTADSLVSAGGATVTVTGRAIDPGAGSPAGPHSISVPLVISAASVDLRVTGIEVTQGVQYYNLPAKGSDLTAPVPYNGVSLAAGGKTVVRVFANARYAPPGADPRAEVSLYGTRDGAPLPGSPLTPDYGPASLKVSSADTVDDASRGDPNGAFTFTLPASWTSGTITLTARIVPAATGLMPVSVCSDAYCDADSTFTLTSIPFTPTGSVSVLPIALAVNGKPLKPPTVHAYRCVKDCYNNPYPTNVPVYHTNFGGVFDSVMNIAPLGDGQFQVPDVYEGQIDVTPIADGTICKSFLFSGFTCDSTFKGDLAADMVRKFANDQNWLDGDEFNPLSNPLVVGVYPGGQPIRSKTSWHSTGLCTGWDAIDDCDMWPVAVVQDSGRPLTSVAHEVFHMLGRNHASAACGGGDGGQATDDWPPDQRGRLQGVGLDRTAASGDTTVPYKIMDPGPAGVSPELFDFMSYCANENTAWISTRNWNTTLSGLQSGPAGSPAAVPDLSARQAQRPAEPVLHVEALAVGPHAAITDVTPTTGWAAPQGQQNRQSPFHVIARNAAGAAVADTPVLPVAGHSDHGAVIYSLSTQVPARGVASVEIALNGVVVAKRSRSPHAPVVQLLSPAAGEQVGRTPTVLVRWNAADADGNGLMATVDYSTNDGRSWRPVYLGPNRNQVELPGYYFARSSTARVRVRINDGFNETAAVSGRFTSLGTGPGVTITSPAPGQQIASDSTVYLSGNAYGDDLRPLAGQQLKWYVGGKLVGTGRSAGVAGLAPGATTIQLVATDRNGRSESRSVGVRVLAAQPRFLTLRTPERLGFRDRVCPLLVSANLPGTLSIRGQHYTVDRMPRELAIAIAPGTQPLILPLRLTAGNQTTTVTLRILRAQS